MSKYDNGPISFVFTIKKILFLELIGKFVRMVNPVKTDFCHTCIIQYRISSYILKRHFTLVIYVFFFMRQN